MDITIDEVIWGEWNVQHMFEKHNVLPEDILTSLSDPKVIAIPAKQGRMMILGRAGKRLLSTIVREQEPKRYFVITSRDMSKKERALYRSQEEE